MFVDVFGGVEFLFVVFVGVVQVLAGLGVFVFEVDLDFSVVKVHVFSHLCIIRSLLLPQHISLHSLTQPQNIHSAILPLNCDQWILHPLLKPLRINPPRPQILIKHLLPRQHPLREILSLPERMALQLLPTHSQHRVFLKQPLYQVNECI